MSTTAKKGKTSTAAGTEPGTSAPAGEPRLVDIVNIFHDARVRREYVEMVVFVLVLVCFLRLFGAEAYVIPSGSMAPTLLGANKIGVCPECGHVNIVNARGEAEDGRPVDEGLCQNCQHTLLFKRGEYSAGDRVLVDKLEYQRGEPRPWDVAVFKFPDGVKRDGNGQVRSARTNYIKRMIGRPNETVGIEFGDLFIRDDQKKDATFEILRKPDRVAMATRRLVWDNEHPPADLVKEGFPERWSPAKGSGAKPSEDRTFIFPVQGENAIEYQHFVRTEITRSPTPRPSLINDFETYNTDNFHRLWFYALGMNWVGDLMIECDLRAAAGDGVFCLELGKGPRRYRAEFNFADHKIHIFQDDQEVATAPHSMTAGPTNTLRFSDFDDRLIIWINGSPVTTEWLDRPIPARGERGPTASDLVPVRIFTRDLGGVVSQIKLYRDIYYTRGAENIVSDVDRSDFLAINTPAEIDSYRNQLLLGQMRTFSLGPDQFFVLGDNSPHSADARDWSRTHHVDRRLLLGRAVARYWPVIRFEGSWPALKWKFVE